MRMATTSLCMLKLAIVTPASLVALVALIALFALFALSRRFYT